MIFLYVVGKDRALTAIAALRREGRAYFSYYKRFKRAADMPLAGEIVDNAKRFAAKQEFIARYRNIAKTRNRNCRAVDCILVGRAAHGYVTAARQAATAVKDVNGAVLALKLQSVQPVGTAKRKACSARNGNCVRSLIVFYRVGSAVIDKRTLHCGVFKLVAAVFLSYFNRTGNRRGKNLVPFFPD